VLGLLAGEIALKKLKCKKYFGLEIKVWGANERPKSCLIDGLQLSTGATYGKGNMEKLRGRLIKIKIKDKTTRKNMALTLKKGVINLLDKTTTHKDSEILANKLYRGDCSLIFNLKLTT